MIHKKFLVLYLANEVGFEQDMLQGCVSSYHLHVWLFLVNLDDFLSWSAQIFTKVVVYTWYVTQNKSFCKSQNDNGTEKCTISIMTIHGSTSWRARGFGWVACGGGLRVAAGYPTLRMETDKIRMESNSDNTFYHIFSRIQIWIRMFSNTNTKKMSWIQKHIRIFTRFGR
jgi:hypothetical protein